MGGSTDREGRVEVCVGGRRWRTVCTGNQELAGAICSQMGYIFEGNGRSNNALNSISYIIYIYTYIYIGSSVAAPSTFPPGSLPEHRLDCTQLSNGIWHCSPVEQQCVSFVELGVVCENLYNDCSTNCTLSVATTLSPTIQQGRLINCRSSYKLLTLDMHKQYFIHPIYIQLRH